jgi:hypothetical protein
MHADFSAPAHIVSAQAVEQFEQSLISIKQNLEKSVCHLILSRWHREIGATAAFGKSDHPERVERAGSVFSGADAQIASADYLVIT